MIIEAVFVFGALTAVFEMVIISMISPYWRLRLLGSPAGRNVTHFVMLVTNLVIHWGTLVGTTSSVLAFVASIVTIQFLRRLYGYVENGRYYTPGIFVYPIEELK